MATSDVKNYESETHLTLDITTLMAALDTFTKGQHLPSNPVKIGGMLGQCQFYPSGYSTSGRGDYCSCLLFIKQKNLNVPNNYFIHLTFKCGSMTSSIIDSISKCHSGVGIYSLFTKQHVESNPTIHITVKILQYPIKLTKKISLINCNKNDNKILLMNELENMYKMSKEYGDITLIIKNNQYNIDNAPPTKKRKLNNNNDCMSEVGRIKVSSLMLRCSSLVFDNMLKNNMIESQTKQITIYAESVRDVDDMIYFNLTNKLRNDCNAINIICLAHFYEMNRLKWKCINKLLNDLNVSNFVKVINIFEKFEITKGYNILLNFAKNNIKELKDKNQFMKLSHIFKCAALTTVDD